jgi:hypothetical protein
METMFEAVNLSGVLDFVVTAGVVIIGIALAYKAIPLAKRAVRSA